MEHSHEHLKARSHCDTRKATCPRTRLGCAGTSLLETVIWLAIIAALASVLIWLLWKTSH